MTCFHYVYILESVGHPDRFYVGLTEDLSARLKKHNAGGVPHTAKFRPWRIKTALAFTIATAPLPLRPTSKLPPAAPSPKSVCSRPVFALRATTRQAAKTAAKTSSARAFVKKRLQSPASATTLIKAG